MASPEEFTLNFFHMLILAVVEGLTEFLPISSTGHLIAASALLGINDHEFVKTFNIVIQSGAIFSVIVLYWRKFLPFNFEFYKKLFFAFLPAAVIGFAVRSQIDRILGSVEIVATTLVLGGIVLLGVDRRTPADPSAGRQIENLAVVDCLKIGVLQCLAFVPGVSRAAATILGGLWVGLSKREATEFSFFLAVPTLVGASALKFAGVIPKINSSNMTNLGLGLVLSFAVATVAIKFFIALVENFGFKHFGYYRIIAGLFLFFLLYVQMV